MQELHCMLHTNKKEKPSKMDPFSYLPDPIAHQIMSWLPKAEITRISAVSKRFFSLWSSFPVIEFDQSMFTQRVGYNRAANTHRFLDHILNSMQLRRINTVISEFRVKGYLQGISTDPRFDMAIKMALDNGVKCMDLDLTLAKSNDIGLGFIAKYHLPAEFGSRSINVLKLKGLELDLCNLIQYCPSLGTLSLSKCVILRDVKFSSKTLTEIDFHCCVVKFIKINAPKLNSFFFDSGIFNHKPCVIDVSQCQDITYLSLNNIVSGRDWIEENVNTLGKLKTFFLNKCGDIERIRIWNEKLEKLQIVDCPLLASTGITAWSLESFLYKGPVWSNVNYVTSKYIKDLSIESENLTDRWLESQIPTLTSLESLRLHGCNLLKTIRIFHEKLQILELNNCNGLAEADIDTPELVSFMYNGHIIVFGMMVTRGNCTATLRMKPWTDYNDSSFYGWRKMLSYFGHCKVLKLIFNSREEVMMPKELKEKLVPPLYDLQHLEIQIQSVKKIDTHLVDSLLWLSPLPNTLTIYYGSPQFQMIIKFSYNEMINKEINKGLLCCRDKLIPCWRHSFKSVEIHTSDASLKRGSIELQKYFFSKSPMLDRVVLA